MQLKKIQYFIKIVETGSLSKAAESLYLTQPTLSRFLMKLEDEVGAELFIREKNNALTLTECGRLYYETSVKINELWDGLSTSISSYRNASKEKNIIRIGTADDDLQPYISSCIDLLLELYPDVHCHLYHYSVNELQKKIEDGSLDIATSAYISKNDNFKYIDFRSSEVDLVVSPENELARWSYKVPGHEKFRLSVKDLPENVAFALIHEPTILRREEDKYFKKMKVNPNVQRTYIEHETISEIISHSTKLVGFCPRHLKSDKMAYIALDPPFFYKSAVYYRKGRELSPAEKKMVSLLQKQPLTRQI
ncbi:MAG: LysR family transcriptional regulator [Oscillospiraceae bacterium]|nr:LysR family transcriptional regulator [Oscillospiraceae bacterium]